MQARQRPTGTTGASQPPTVLEMRDVRKTYGATTVLDLTGVELNFRAGEVHAIAGENGAGKSTLIGLMAGVIPPSSGSMVLGGEGYSPHSILDAGRRGVAVVLQEPSTIPSMTVAENLLLGSTTPYSKAGVFTRAAQHRAAARVAAFIDYPLPLGQRVGELDPEQRKMLELARALSTVPAVLIIDEMTASLGRRGVEVLKQMLAAFTAAGGTAIYISHYLEEVFELCDRVTVLKDGRLVETSLVREINNDQLCVMMVGRATESGMYGEPANPPSSVPVLKVEHLRVANSTVQDASFSVAAGEIVGFAGLAGCGSIDVARALFGDVRSHGVIELAGRKVAPNNPRQAMQLGIGLLPTDRENEGLHLDQSMARNIALPSIARIFHRGWGSGRAERRATRWFTSGFNIRGDGDVVRSLSGGNRQKVALARWILRDSPMLVLENPTRGVDVGAKTEIYGIIRETAAKGKGILLVSDELPELLGLCDRVLVMRRGTVVAEHHRRDDITEEQLIAEMV